jgi:hypothetical protein
MKLLMLLLLPTCVFAQQNKPAKKAGINKSTNKKYSPRIKQTKKKATEFDSTGYNTPKNWGLPVYDSNGNIT